MDFGTLNVTVTLRADETLVQLLAALLHLSTPTPVPAAVNAPAPYMQAAAPVTQSAPQIPTVQPQVQQSAPVAPVVPTAPAMPTPAPTSERTYTLEDIGRAGGTLVDAGKVQELCSLLAQFGVQSIQGLQPAQYGAFATALRGMGAQI